MSGNSIPPLLLTCSFGVGFGPVSTSTVPSFMANECARADSSSSSASLGAGGVPLRKVSAPRRRDSMAFSMCSTQCGMFGCKGWLARNHNCALCEGCTWASSCTEKLRPTVQTAKRKPIRDPRFAIFGESQNRRQSALGAAVLSTPVSCMQLSALLFFVQPNNASQTTHESINPQSHFRAGISNRNRAGLGTTNKIYVMQGNCITENTKTRCAYEPHYLARSCSSLTA